MKHTLVKHNQCPNIFWMMSIPNYDSPNYQNVPVQDVDGLDNKGSKMVPRLSE